MAADILKRKNLKGVKMKNTPADISKHFMLMCAVESMRKHMQCSQEALLISKP